MKKFKHALLALMLSGTLLVQTACMGSFALTLKVYEINKTITDDKFVNNLIFWIVGAPVYGFTTTIDVMFLNLIEFWTDSNPLANAEMPATDNLWAIQHERLQLQAGFNSMKLQQLEAGELVSEKLFTYDAITKTWFLQAADGAIPMFAEHNGQVKFFFDQQELLLSSEEVVSGIRGLTQQESVWAMR